MSNTKPTNRTELKEYIKLKLGSPVIQVNLDDTQFDMAIDDAFQYFYERQHFDAIEKVYLSVKIEDSFTKWLGTKETESVAQSDDQQRYADGIVDTLTLTTPGTGYGPEPQVVNTTGGTGSGLTVTIAESRTTGGGLIDVTVHATGSEYQVGDVVTIDAGDKNATFTVTALKASSPLNGSTVVGTQNNYVVLPDGVIGVNQILGTGAGGAMGGMFPGAVPFNPFLAGGAGGACGQLGGMNFGLTSYYTMRQYLSTLSFLLYPPKSYSYNKRTHRLFLNTKNFRGQVATGNYLVLECDIEANADFYPDVWNDMFLKELAVAYTQITWGRVLTKYNQVQLPGGITLNGETILQEGQQAAQALKERFALDYADYPLDMVG